MASDIVAKNRQNQLTEKRPIAARNMPVLMWEQDKWATTRVLPVESIYENWKNSPYRVRAFSDRKLSDFSMVMLRKDTFEGMVKTLQDLQSGEAVIRSNFEAVFNSVNLVGKLAAKHGQDDELNLAVKTLIHVFGTISTVIEYSAPVKKVHPSALTNEEVEELKKIEAENKR